MHELTPIEYLALLRQDYYAFLRRGFAELNPQAEFLPNWHIECVAAKLHACFERKIRRLIINVPPRHLKSLAASVALPAFWLGHDPSARIMCVSYGQELADKLSRDCRTLMASDWYRRTFSTRLSPQRQAVQEFTTTGQGFRLATSVGGVVTGRGANAIIIDDPLKPEEALSETQRRNVNEFFDHTLYSRLDDKARGCIILIMQRLHEDDLVGHVLGQEPWEIVSFPAIAEKDETHEIETPLGRRIFTRRAGEMLHPERESRETLGHIRATIGEYNFAGQYQQAPTPLGGGMVKAEWFQTYEAHQLPENFERIVQSWDTANKATQLSDYSVCTTWGLKDKHIYLLNVFRRQLNYPELKRSVREQWQMFGATVILIEDKASGTQLIQELVADGIHAMTRYEPEVDKTMRMHAQTAAIENGFVHLPRAAHWLPDYIHELATFPKGKHDDQVNSTAQALDWIKKAQLNSWQGLLKYYEREAEKALGISRTPAGEISMRAPSPHQNYFMSGTNGRARRYSSDADGIIENVHPDDVERLLRQGCTRIMHAQTAVFENG